jgi:coenzyme F420-reducing hydrogenase delta subunit
MNKVKTGQKVVVFSCSWHGYSSLEEVGKERLSLPAEIVPIQLPCLGRLSPGIILSTFELGVSGVLLLGCPEGQCHYLTGNLEAIQIIDETRSLLKLLGYDPAQVDYLLLPAKNSDQFLDALHSFWSQLPNGREKT